MDEAVGIGRKLAHEIIAIADGDHDDDYDSTRALEESYVEVDLRSRRFGMPPGEHTCRKPELGPLAATGASDHPTSLAALRPDDLDPRDVDRHDCQAPKRDLGGISRLMSGYKNSA